ncbi:MAG TPA: hypothetical protein VNY05_15695 [Candidatus Acidoferrales bacterium]|nr:hypothetical protein [Candidatus Acidoferrales bacterium]
MEKKRIRQVNPVYATCITTRVWVDGAEDGLTADLDEWLKKLALFRPPQDGQRSKRVINKIMGE